MQLTFLLEGLSTTAPELIQKMLKFADVGFCGCVACVCVRVYVWVCVCVGVYVCVHACVYISVCKGVGFM